MHPIFNPIGYIFIGSVVIIVLYQVYYHWLGGKKHAHQMQLKEFILYSIQAIKELDKKQSQEKQQFDNDLANGNVYILPPRYFTIPKRVLFILFIIMIIFVCYLIFEGFLYIDELAKNCENIFNIQASFFKVVCIFGWFSLSFILITTWYMNYFFQKYIPHDKVKAGWFKARTVYKYKSNVEKPDFINGYVNLAFLTFFIFLTLPTNVRSDLQKLDVNSANQFYHQQCLEKQQKIKEK